jgi:predicted nucleic acid-binding protein
MRQFFDTNILVYSQDPREPKKREIARALIGEAIGADAFVLSTQVLAEFYAACVRRKLLGPIQVLRLVQLWSEHDTVSHTPDLVVRGLGLHQHHSISMWDAFVIQAALDARCDVLLSEDLQHGRRFGDLEIRNPFAASGAHERPAAPYRARRARKGAARAR